jgi:hypothetical protein
MLAVAGTVGYHVKAMQRPTFNSMRSIFVDITVADYIAIQDLIARFNRQMDGRNWDAFGKFFTEDAVMAITMPSEEIRHEGRIAIVDQMKNAQESRYAVNFHLAGNFTTDSVEQDRIIVDVPVLGFAAFLPGKGDGLRFSSARSKWKLIRHGGTWLISEFHHRVFFGGVVPLG